MIDRDSNADMDQDPAEEEESEGIDVERIKELAGFVLRSARRRPTLSILTFVVVAGLGLTLATAMPQVYNAQLKLLAERSHIDDTNPNRRSGTVDRPTQDLAAMIMRRDNLVTLVHDAHLVDRVDVGRSGLLKLKDRIMSAITGPPSVEDREMGLVFSLEKRLTVEVLPDDATAVISVDWPSAQAAYDLVTLVQRNFLEARYDTEVSAITEIIDVSEEHAKDELAQVDAALANYQKIIAERLPLTADALNKPPLAGSAPARIGVQGWAGTAQIGRPDPELAKALEVKRQRIKTLEESQQRTLEALRQQLAQAQLTLTALHPTVIGLQQQIEAVSEPSPELSQLREDERALMAQIAPVDASMARGMPGLIPATRPRDLALEANAFGSSSTSSSSSSSAFGAGQAVTLPTLDRDGQVQLAESKLGSAIRSYQEALSRVDAAKLELQTERVAFKHRYTVVTPAELPRKPKKATAALVGFGSVLGGALLALLLAAAADMLGGRVLETWQVRRRLKLDVLGELDMPS